MSGQLILAQLVGVSRVVARTVRSGFGDIEKSKDLGFDSLYIPIGMEIHSVLTIVFH